MNLTDYSYDLNTVTRRAETRIETDVPNIYLQISTVHDNGFFASSLERIKIENGFISIKISTNRFDDTDPAPISRLEVKGRYSKKDLSYLHEYYIESITEDILTDAIKWAERF